MRAYFAFILFIVVASYISSTTAGPNDLLLNLLEGKKNPQGILVDFCGFLVLTCPFAFLFAS
jgi:hypothetical protein